jgi:hypothetical protein
MIFKNNQCIFSYATVLECASVSFNLCEEGDIGAFDEGFNLRVTYIDRKRTTNKNAKK